MKKLVKNTFVMSFSQIISNLLLMVVFLVVARYLGEDLYGIYSSGFAIVILFEIFTNLGLHSVLIRDVARDKKALGKYFGNLAFMKSILSILVYAGLLLFVKAAGYDQRIFRACIILGVYMVINSFSSLVKTAFQANQEMEYDSLLNIAKSMVLVGLSCTIAYLHLDIAYLFYSYVLASLTELVLGIWFLRRYKLQNLSFDIPSSLWLLKSSVPFILTAIFLTAYQRMDIIILSKVAPTGSVGNYGAALNLVSPVFIIISFFMVALFPFLSENHKDIAKLSKMFYWMVLLFLIVALPGVFMLYHLAPLITIVLPNFSSLVSVFQILVFSILTGFLVNLCITFLAALDKQDIGAAISFMLMVLVIPATIYLSMSFQEHGAAYARLLIEFVSGITSVYIMGKFIKLNITKVLILLFASAVAFIPTLFFPIVLPFGIAFYAFVASIIIDKEDRHYLLSLIHKR